MLSKHTVLRAMRGVCRCSFLYDSRHMTKAVCLRKRRQSICPVRQYLSAAAIPERMQRRYARFSRRRSFCGCR